MSDSIDKGPSAQRQAAPSTGGSGTASAAPITVYLVVVAGRGDGNYAFAERRNAANFRDAVISAGTDPDEVYIDELPLCGDDLAGELIAAEFS